MGDYHFLHQIFSGGDMIMHVVHESETSTTTHTFCIHTCVCFAVKKSDKKIRNKREPSCGSSTDLVYYIRGRMARTLLLISDVPIVLDHYVKCSSHCWIFPCFNNVSNNLGTVSAQLQKVARISGFLFSFPSVSFFHTFWWEHVNGQKCLPFCFSCGTQMLVARLLDVLHAMAIHNRFAPGQD